MPETLAPSVDKFNDLVGIPYADRGRTTEGADCWGLAVLAYAAHGIELPRYDAYQDVANRDRAELGGIIEAERGDWRPVFDPNALDLILFRVLGVPSHIAVVVERGRMLNTWRGGASAIEHYDTRKWWSRIEGFYRYAA